MLYPMISPLLYVHLLTFPWHAPGHLVEPRLDLGINFARSEAEADADLRTKAKDVFGGVLWGAFLKLLQCGHPPVMLVGLDSPQ